jgi:hypothetical protein
LSLLACPILIHETPHWFYSGENFGIFLDLAACQAHGELVDCPFVGFQPTRRFLASDLWDGNPLSENQSAIVAKNGLESVGPNRVGGKYANSNANQRRNRLHGKTCPSNKRLFSASFNARWMRVIGYLFLAS